MNTTLIIIYAIIFQIILVVTIVCGSIISSGQTLSSIFKKIPSTAYIITGTSILLTYLAVQASSYKEATTVGFNIVDRAELKIYEKFVEYYDNVPEFIDSLNFNSIDIKNTNTKKQDTIETYIATLIFQSIEDYIISAPITDLSDREWFTMFCSFFSSEKLRNLWKKNYINFAEYTIKYINRLIKFIDENKSNFNSPENISHFCGEFVLTKEYKELLNKKDRYNISFSGY